MAAADHRHNWWPETPMFGIYIEQVEGRLGNYPRVPPSSWIVSRVSRGQPRTFIINFFISLLIRYSPASCQIYIEEV